MSELDEAWGLAIAEAEASARAQGRADIADYLALRTSNDLIRKIATEWLLTVFTGAAGEANRNGAAIQLASDSAHRFKVGNSSMVGPRLSLRRSVRELVVELGWPRTPRDGFIRGGGLACGNIRHVGIKPDSEELRLIIGDGGAPRWIVLDKHGSVGQGHELHEANIRRHLTILLAGSAKPHS
jgi:hypothetical protein